VNCLLSSPNSPPVEVLQLTPHSLIPDEKFCWKVVNVKSDQEVLLTPAEVASLFRVDPKTVTRWAKSGKLTSIRTLGGHRRYKESEVKALLLKTTSNS
jgi:excisionase family DNA binding protein